MVQFYQQDIVQLIASPQSYGIVLVRVVDSLVSILLLTRHTEMLARSRGCTSISLTCRPHDAPTPAWRSRGIILS